MNQEMFATVFSRLVNSGLPITEAGIDLEESECDNCGMIEVPLKNGYCYGCTCEKCGKGGTVDMIWNWCPDCMLTLDLPKDYEACGECGFDHAYEYEQASSIHKGDKSVKENNMDPNETLFDATNAADYLREWLNKPLDDETPPNQTAVEELLNAFDSLNEWLKKGGALPDAWRASTPEPEVIDPNEECACGMRRSGCDYHKRT